MQSSTTASRPKRLSATPCSGQIDASARFKLVRCADAKTEPLPDFVGPCLDRVHAVEDPPFCGEVAPTRRPARIEKHASAVGNIRPPAPEQRGLYRRVADPGRSLVNPQILSGPDPDDRGLGLWAAPALCIGEALSSRLIDHCVVEAERADPVHGVREAPPLRGHSNSGRGGRWVSAGRPVIGWMNVRALCSVGYCRRGGVKAGICGPRLRLAPGVPHAQSHNRRDETHHDSLELLWPH
jgi:hypothetical protein